MRPVLDHGQQAQVLGVDVDAVVVGQGQAGLELARQIDLAVDRLFRGSRFAARHVDRLAVEPDFVIGAGARSQVAGDAGSAVSCSSAWTPAWQGRGGQAMTLRSTSPQAPSVRQQAWR